MDKKSGVSYLNLMVLVGLVAVCSILVTALLSGSNVFPRAPQMQLGEQLTGSGALLLIPLSIVILFGFFLVAGVNAFLPPKDGSWSFLVIAGVLVLPLPC